MIRIKDLFRSIVRLWNKTMKRKYKFPRSAGQYNDIVIYCPGCHNRMLIFSGFRKYHKCDKCGLKLRDRDWKSQCAFYKHQKSLKFDK